MTLNEALAVYRAAEFEYLCLIALWTSRLQRDVEDTDNLEAKVELARHNRDDYLRLWRLTVETHALRGR